MMDFAGAGIGTLVGGIPDEPILAKQSISLTSNESELIHARVKL